MSKKMLVNATQPEENRVAIVEDGILTELDIEVVGREQTRGNIYKATVVRVESGLQAAFVDYGGQRLGFLQMGEIHPDLFKAADPEGERKGRLRVNDVLRRGQEILVQVVKGERGNKGAALTTFLSLAGRYMVLMPESDSTGVSRKIEEDSVRKKLKATMNSLDLPKNMGYIVRTAGVDQSKEELKRDFDYLVRVYENILALAKKAKSPALIYKESNLVIRSIRDYFTPDIDEVLVDDPKVAQEAKDFLQQVMPECVKLVKLHQEKRPIFSRYQIEEQIEIISRNKVLLPSGGSIVIDRTEALVAIDVNSGKMAGEQGVEATAYKTNLEAAIEVGRQLRLRDLGGLIVIDFIDMRERKNGRDVERALKEAMKNDKAKVSFGKISSFGLLEMSRQRIKDALAEGTFLICPHCEGSGRLKSPEAQAVAALRKIQGGLAKGHIARIEVDIPLDAANYLLNAMRDELFELEQRNQLEIMVRGRADMIASQIEILCIRREKEDELYLQPVTAVNDEAQPPRDAHMITEVPAAVQTEPSTPPEKKRGSRKKSVPAEEIDASQPAKIETTEAVSANDAEALTSEASEPADLPVTTETTEVEGARKKRKRRRKKKKAISPDTVEATHLPEEEGTVLAGDEGSDAECDDLPGTEETEEAASATEGSNDIPARKKRRRKRKKKGTAPNAEENITPLASAEESAADVTEEISESLEESGDFDESASADEPENKKKRKRRRKKRSPSSGDDERAAEGPGLEIPPATLLPASPEELDIHPVPVAAAETASLVATTPASVKGVRKAQPPIIPAASEIELPPTLMVEAPPEEKPKKKRATAKKKATEVASAEVPETTEMPTEAIVAVKKAPRASRAKTTKTTEESLSGEEIKNSAPKKTRTPRKKSDETQNAPATGELSHIHEKGE